MASKKVRANNTPVDIEKGTYQEIKRMYEEGNIKSIRNKVNTIMKLYLERNKLHRTYFQHLDMIGVRENAIFIHDKKQDKTAHVKIKKGRLTCDLENREDCEHVVLCMLCNDSVEMLAKVMSD